MTSVKLVDGTIIQASNVELVNGVLKITTITDMTVEKLAELFSNKSNTALIILLTDSGVESGYKSGFTSFAGINYDSEGNKTIELYNPVDATESRISNAEAAANKATNEAKEAESDASTSLQVAKETSASLENLQAQVDYIAIMTEVE